MKEYNDYAKLTRGYLYHYNAYCAMIKNLENERNDLNEKLKAVPVGNSLQDYYGGTAELNKVEKTAYERDEIRAKLKIIEADIKNISSNLDRVDIALKGLTKEEQFIVKSYFVERIPWKEISKKIYLSERWTKIKGYAIIKKLAVCIFGTKAQNKNTNFIFY